MLKKLFRVLFSLPFTGVLLTIYAVALAIATILETKFGTDTAKLLVYNATWLELLYGIMAVNLTGNIFRFKMWRNGKFTIGLFHFALLIMLLGATITRYVGTEGMMHIRENEKANSMISSESYFSMQTNSESYTKQATMSPILSPMISHTFENDLEVDVVKFIEHAQKALVPSPNGKAVIEIMVSNMMSNQQEYLFFGEQIAANNISISFEGEPSDIVLKQTVKGIEFTSSVPVKQLTMGMSASKDSASYKGIFEQGKIYQVGTTRIVPRRFIANAELQAVKSTQQTGKNAVLVDLILGSKKKRVTLWNQKGIEAIPQTVEFEGQNITLSYGNKTIDLPFTLQLNKFILTRYEGSNSPASFESVVQLIDSKNGVNQEERIFMNNVLDYQGYRFFQSSYDQDEKGTILSVNHDKRGTMITYIGYFILFLGMFLSVFAQRSYFIKTLKSSTKIATIIALLVLFGKSTQAQTIPESATANEFGKILTQGPDGRVEPFSTYSTELLLKMTSRSRWEGNTPDQVILGMILSPVEWKKTPMIKVAEEELATLLGRSGKYASFNDFFSNDGSYLLNNQVSEVYRKNPAMRNNFERELVKVDERVNVAYMIYNYSVFRFFPDPQKGSDKWISPAHIKQQVSAGDSLFIQNIISLYTATIDEKQTQKGSEYVEAIKKYQQKTSIVSLPSDTKISLEHCYNKLLLFKRLFPIYLLLGFVLAFLYFLRILKGETLSKWVERTFYVLFISAFSAHTAALVIRGVLAGHMPWSNGYESMIYVAWSAMLAGLLFSRRNVLVLASAALLAGITLFVAHLSWMNPEITNLVPVLRSYWLTFHVAIITASYGFIGVSAFIGLFNMILMIVSNEKNKTRIDAILKQLTGINEISIILGLYMLTIGTFLGGVWANESWGRYWGWDPKETWSLITIVVYTFVSHMRMISGLKGRFAFNFASVIAFASVIMTYLGVNYYLSGLHSYGAGKAGSVTITVSIAFAIVALLSLWAREKESKRVQ